MWLMLAGLAGVCGGGCRGEDLTAPRARPPAPARVLVVADTLCVRAQFTLTGPTSVTTNFPTAAECPSGLVLTRSQPATWVQTPNRRLRLLVRLRNLTGQAVQLPVRLYLPATGTTVVLPAGTPPSKVVAYQPDSSEAGGGRVWFVGGSSVLAAGDSTAEDTLTFQVQSPVTKARWQFQATAQLPGRPTIPTTIWPSSPLQAPSPQDTANVYYRDVVGVLFDDSTSAQTVSAVLGKYHGTVIGGSALPSGTGEYYVQVPDPGPGLVALDSVIGLLNAENGVRRASRIAIRLRLNVRGRYPNDGTFAARADWFQRPAPVGTASRLSIRAPLAWGCETGTYGTQRVRVGVVDVSFEQGHGDLDTANVELFPLPPGAVLSPAPILSGAGGVVTRAHGTGVAGVLAAVGDNGSGVAGVVWSADLNLYHYGVDSFLTNAPDLRFEDALRAAASAGTRVVTTSVAFGDPHDLNLVARLRDALEFFLQDPNAVFVIANGNDTLRVPIAQVATGVDPQVTAVDRAAAELYATRGSQIVFAAGSDGGTAVWYASNVWIGATSVAAPAEEILSLGRTTEPQPGFPAGTRAYSGTSFSAPFIAGTLAALFAMDPTLTGAMAKDYLLRGAQDSLLDSLTGQRLPRQPLQVAGAPGTIYQLDAYGSLSLLSKERMGTPVCGIPVSVTQQNPSYIRLERTPTAIESFPVAALSGAQNPSVAQGGRVISVTDGDKYGTTGVDRITATLQNGAWGERARTPWDGATFERWYLEEDTALVQLVPGPPNTFFTDRFVLRLKHPDGSTTGPINMCEADPPSTWQYLVECSWAISPAADFFATAVMWQTSLSTPSLQRFSLAPVGSDAPTRMQEYPWDGNFGVSGPAAWTPDGRRFLQVLSTSPFIPAAGTVLNFEYGTAWTPRAIAVPPGGATFGSMTFIEGGAGVRSTEITGGSCVTTVRGAHALALGSTLGGCDTIARVFPNLAGPPAALAARGAPAASTRVRTGAPSRRVMAN
ncbi:MAG: S8 family serine peptidase [Gemmatimonadetes bacterium]|nr:S8 family serine peptidase [Gemmatimonadota bacterium]